MWLRLRLLLLNDDSQQFHEYQEWAIQRHIHHWAHKTQNEAGERTKNQKQHKRENLKDEQHGSKHNYEKNFKMGWGWGLCCLTPLSTMFQWLSVLLVEETGIPGEKKPTRCRSLTNCIAQCCIEYTSPWAGFEITTSVVIGTYCIGSCKSNYGSFF